MINQWQREDYCVSTDRDRLDIDAIHSFLSKSYWGDGRRLEVVKRSIDHSLPFGLYKGEQLIGFARVVTDYATFAWLADVFVLNEFRARGLSKWLLEAVVSHPDLEGLKRWILATRDAHELYGKFAFTNLKNPEWFMERTHSSLEARPQARG